MFALLLAQATNPPPVPVPPVTGNETIDNLINAYPIILVAIVIQVIGALLYKTERVSNKWIPLINVGMGAFSYPGVIGIWSMKTVLLGILAGAGSTGIYEAYKQLRPGAALPEPPKPEPPPNP